MLLLDKKISALHYFASSKVSIQLFKTMFCACLLLLTSCGKNDTKIDMELRQAERIAYLEKEIPRLSGVYAAYAAKEKFCEPARFVRVETAIGTLLARCTPSWSETNKLSAKVDIVNPTSIRVMVERTKIVWFPEDRANRVSDSAAVEGESRQSIVVEPGATMSQVVMLRARERENPVSLFITLEGSLASRCATGDSCLSVAQPSPVVTRLQPPGPPPAVPYNPLPKSKRDE